MDVGNPSNLERINELYCGDVDEIRRDVYSASYSDDDTRKGIKEVFEKYNYILEPHGAVGYKAFVNYAGAFKLKEINGIIVETAHPVKFKDVVEETISKSVDIPERLAVCLDKKKRGIKIDASFGRLKELLIAG